MHRLWFGAAVVALLVAGPALSAQAAETPYWPRTHVWINNPGDSAANPLLSFSVPFEGWDLDMPLHAVSHFQAPRLTPVDPNGHLVTHCQAPRPIGTGAVNCDVRGDSAIAPGDSSMSGGVARELDGGGVEQIDLGTVTLTVCDGACSSLFSVSAAPSPLRLMVNTELATQAQGTFTFNTDWVATDLAFSQLTAADGSVAPGNWTVVADQPADGSHFGFSGTLTQPGRYSMTAQVTDEFGVDHSVTVPVIVCGDDTCMASGAALASTGTAHVDVAGLGALLASAVGVVLIQLRQRRSAALLRHT